VTRPPASAASTSRADHRHQPRRSWDNPKAEVRCLGPTDHPLAGHVNEARQVRPQATALIDLQPRRDAGQRRERRPQQPVPGGPTPSPSPQSLRTGRLQATRSPRRCDRHTTATDARPESASSSGRKWSMRIDDRDAHYSTALWNSVNVPKLREKFLEDIDSTKIGDPVGRRVLRRDI
jgi:hypothetical protein